MTVKRFFHSLFYACLCVGILMFGTTACRSSSNKQQVTPQKIKTVSFPNQVHAKYAKGFRITYHKDYKLLEVLNPSQSQMNTLRYALVPRKLTDKISVPNARKIPIPIKSMIATSTTHVALTEMLNATDILKGVVGAKYVYNSQVRDMLKKGKISSFPMGQFNKEVALNMQPDIVMVPGGQASQLDNYKILRGTGIHILVNADWLETTPLGKAEWVKVMAALLNKEKVANEKFSGIAQRYNQLKASVDSLGKRPLVIANMPYKGAWFVPGGDSYNATFFRDAGANYPWSDSDQTGGMRKDFEVVYQLGLKADVWINPGAAKTKKDLLAKDSRFKDFKPFKTGKIYNNNRRMSSTGGNDFWESGVVHPDRVLADLVKIFHPARLPNHQYYYYRKVQ
ncbi:MAG TPA: ABC transporter substrate-binding protein [Balneolaceae bacterium]|nr:ABC transporter substrate-binding protein [Balneolaceae bacterium]